MEDNQSRKSNSKNRIADAMTVKNIFKCNPSSIIQLAIFWPCDLMRSFPKLSIIHQKQFDIPL